MKQKLLFLAGLFLCTALAAQTIQNGGFENWNTTSFENPQYYPYTSNTDVLQFGLPFNALKVSDPQQGTYAIQLQTVANATDTMFGYFIDGDPNTLMGGIPYNQHPVALTGYYKNNTMAGDTAILIVVFKQGGNAISTDVFTFTGNHSTYTSFTMPLSIPPLATPDSVIIGAASSNALMSNGIAGSMLQLDNLSFTGVATQPAQLNGSFENWITTNITTPAHWAAAGDTTYQTTDAHSGSYALQLRTVLFGPSAPGASVATNGMLPPNSGPVGGRPYSLMNDTLCGWYKYTPNGIDSAAFGVSTSANHTQVGGAFMALPPAANYTFFSLPFASFSQPDTLLVVFVSSSANTTMSNVGSVLKVDDLYLKSSPLSTGPEISWNTFGLVKIYPNPSNGDCWLEWDNRGDAATVMTITDGPGRIVSEESVSGTGRQREHIDTSTMDKGVYTITLSQDGKTMSRKLVVE